MTSGRDESDGYKASGSVCVHVFGGWTDKGYYLPPPSICHHQRAAVSTSSAHNHLGLWENTFKLKKGKREKQIFETRAFWPKRQVHHWIWQVHMNITTWNRIEEKTLWIQRNLRIKATSSHQVVVSSKSAVFPQSFHSRAKHCGPSKTLIQSQLCSGSFSIDIKATWYFGSYIFIDPLSHVATYCGSNSQTNVLSPGLNCANESKVVCVSALMN